MSDRDGLIALHEAKPKTEFELIAEKIKVEVGPWNGGCFTHKVTLFEVLKYPTAFDLQSMKVLTSEDDLR